MKKQSRFKMDLQVFAGNKRLGEIEARKAEIRGLLEGDGDVNLDELETELRTLNEEETAIEKRAAVAAGIKSGTVETRKVDEIDEPKKEIRNLKWNEAIGTAEYRSAWAKDMLGQSLTPEERASYDKVNAEYRAFTHTTENSAVLIPKTVVAGIWKRAEEQYPLWADVRKFRVTGDLTMIKSNGASDPADWYAEADTVDNDQLAFGTLNLTGCELAKAVTVTWKLKKMAVDEFIAFIQQEIGDRMGAALSKAVYAGKGKPGVGDTWKPEPRGIKTVLAAQSSTPQIIEYDGTTGLEYVNLTASMGAVFSAYAAGTTIYANNLTIWNTLANMLDGQGRPLFVPDVNAGGVGRIFGRTIKPDATIPVGEILIGNTGAGYVANINEDITMYQEDHVRARTTDYMGYAIVDGDVLDPAAFVILTPAV